MDEVMTGLRVGLHSAQGHYAQLIPGFKPDITVLGKVIGGGMPVAAVGGKKRFMEQLSPLGNVYQAGTLSGNPVAVAAGMATLKLIQAPGFYENLTKATANFASVGGMFGLFASPTPPRDYAEVMQADKPLFNKFFHLMLDAGVHFAPSAYEAGFVSAAHTPEVIQSTVDAAKAAFAQLK
jgi:glutamate-1-semialdehyde 2,1-aminomutase